MGHSCVRAKVRRRKVAALAAYSRQFTVHNTKKGISPKVDHKLYYGELKDAITCPFTGHKFVPTNPHPIPGKYGITVTGYDWIEPEGMLWKPEKYPQPKRLIKCKKRKHTGEKWVMNGAGGWMRVYDTKSGHDKRNDFVTFFPNYPYNLPKMNRVEYMEKLVEHKTKKWERKHPAPMEMFKEDVEKWNKERDTAIERIRDFVVSVYDKLMLTGRFKINKKGMTTYQEEKVAEIKDTDMEGHHINTLPVNSKILKKAQKITDETKAKRANLVCTNLRDHKKQKGRIILPHAQAA